MVKALYFHKLQKKTLSTEHSRWIMFKYKKEFSHQPHDFLTSVTGKCRPAKET